MFTVTTLNVNGLRSAARKGFFDWLALNPADVVCLQEIRVQPDELPEEHRNPQGYIGYFHAAERKGYSGVALYTRKPPLRVQAGLGWPQFDAEGRYLRIDFADVSVVSLYLPSGSSGPERQQVKFAMMECFAEVLKELRQEAREFIICGDWNIAHQNIDLKNWRANQKNSGFLPQERAWLDQLFGEIGYVDAFRVVNSSPEQYTWWSNRGQAWAKNVGWRIDYHVITPGLKDKVSTCSIFKSQRFSDHAPLTLTYKINPCSDG